MKKYVLTFLLGVLLTAVVSAQSTYQAFDITENGLVVPTNGIWIRDNVFLDDAEVMNVHYLEYLHFLTQDSTKEALLAAYPDTNIFGSHHLHQLLHQNRSYYKRKGGKHVAASYPIHDEVIKEPTKPQHWWNYFSYHGTRSYPVVGISYEQATQYCAWRSRFLTEYFNRVLIKKDKYAKLAGKKVVFTFSLPSEADWERAGASGKDLAIFPYGYEDIYMHPHRKLRVSNKRKDAETKVKIKEYNASDSILVFNLKDKEKILYHKEKHEPVSAMDIHPNSYGFYHLIGNVAEMVQEKGVCKGGSYLHTLSQSGVQKQLTYEEPQKWLGFRCACTVTILPE